MKKKSLVAKIGFLLGLSGLFLFVSCNDEASIDDPQSIQEKVSVAKFTSEPIEGQYIIVFEKGFKTKSAILNNLKYEEKMRLLRTEIPQSFSKAGITKENIKNTFVGHPLIEKKDNIITSLCPPTTNPFETRA
mgnify:CR=1 FL=1